MGSKTLTRAQCWLCITSTTASVNCTLYPGSCYQKIQENIWKMVGLVGPWWVLPACVHTFVSTAFDWNSVALSLEDQWSYKTFIRKEKPVFADKLHQASRCVGEWGNSCTLSHIAGNWTSPGSKTTQILEIMYKHDIIQCVKQQKNSLQIEHIFTMYRR